MCIKTYNVFSLHVITIIDKLISWWQRWMTVLSLDWINWSKITKSPKSYYFVIQFLCTMIWSHIVFIKLIGLTNSYIQYIFRTLNIVKLKPQIKYLYTCHKIGAVFLNYYPHQFLLQSFKQNLVCNYWKENLKLPFTVIKISNMHKN